MSMHIVTQDFYVYVHRKASTKAVFYVGKGCGMRAWSLRRGAKWQNIVKKHGVIVEIVECGLQEWAAFEIEKNLIAYYGRESLCNMTDGGEGMAGFQYSDAFKAKVAANSAKQFMSQEFRAKHSASVSLAMTGKKATKLKKESLKAAWDDKEKRDKRISAIRAACAKRYLCIQTGMVFDSLGHAGEWLNSQGKIASTVAKKVSLACNGKRKTAYGYHWAYAD